MDYKEYFITPSLTLNMVAARLHAGRQSPFHFSRPLQPFSCGKGPGGYSENRFHGTQLMFVASAYSRSAWISISSHSHLLTCRRVIIAVTNILIFPHFSEWRGSDTTRKYNNIQLPPVWARLQYGRYTRCIYGQRLRYLKLPT